MFTPTDIQTRIRERPFVPFRIVTTTGQTYDIYRPELAMVGQRARILGAPSSQDPTTFEQVSRVAILHVTEIRDLPMQSPPKTNGPV